MTLGSFRTRSPMRKPLRLTLTSLRLSSQNRQYPQGSSRSIIEETRLIWQDCHFEIIPNRSYADASGFSATATIASAPYLLQVLGCAAPLSQVVRVEPTKTHDYFLGAIYAMKLTFDTSGAAVPRRLLVSMPGRLLADSGALQPGGVSLSSSSETRQPVVWQVPTSSKTSYAIFQARSFRFYWERLVALVGAVGLSAALVAIIGHRRKSQKE